MGEELKPRPEPPPRPAPEAALEGLVVPAVHCPYCREAIAPAAPAKLACNACMAWHHQACWSEHGRCAACGAAASGPPAAASAASAAVGARAGLPPRLAANTQEVDPRLAGCAIAAAGAVLTLMTLASGLQLFGPNREPQDALLLFLAVVSAWLTRFGWRLARRPPAAQPTREYT